MTPPRRRTTPAPEAHAAPSPTAGFVVRHLRIVPGTCTLQDHLAGYTLEDRRQNDVNLFFIMRGELAVIIGGLRVIGRPGDLLITPRNTSQSARSVTPSIRFLSVHVEATLAGGRDVFELLQPPPHRTLDPGARLTRYCEGAADEFARPDPAQLSRMLASWVRLITLELIEDDDRHGRLSPTALDPIVAAVLDELPRRIAERTTLDDLAQLAGFSPQHLNRRFKDALGLTPMQHLRHLRMEAAAAMLAEGAYDVRGVAERVGFDDPFYFSRSFKAFHRRSPSDYRARAGSDSPSPSA